MASPPPATGTGHARVLRTSDLSTLFPVVNFDARTKLNTNFRRYAAISLIFFLPLSLCIMISYSTIFPTAFLPSSLTLTVALTLTGLLSILGVTLITFTIVHDAAFPRCKNLDRITIAVVNHAVSRFFLPVLGTIAAGFLQVAVISLLLAALIKFCVVKFLGFQQIPVAAVSYIEIVCVGITAVFLVPNWGLAAAVTVSEETWGFESLRRSKQVLRLTMRQRDARAMFWRCLLDVNKYVLIPIICFHSNGRLFILGSMWALGIVEALEIICLYTVATTLLYLCCVHNPKIVAHPVPVEEIGNIDPSHVIHVRQ